MYSYVCILIKSNCEKLLSKRNGLFFDYILVFIYLPRRGVWSYCFHFDKYLWFLKLLHFQKENKWPTYDKWLMINRKKKIKTGRVLNLQHLFSPICRYVISLWEKLWKFPKLHSDSRDCVTYCSLLFLVLIQTNHMCSRQAKTELFN